MSKKGSTFGGPAAPAFVDDSGKINLEELNNALEGELPAPVARRVEALTNLHKNYLEIQKQYQIEAQELERKYNKLYEPIYDKRATIVNGSYEPTDEEARVEKDREIARKEAAPEDAEIKGIPQFWLTVMQNNVHVSRYVFENDEKALEFLKDVRCADLEGGEFGFTLTFHFAENPYFTNTTLTKTYYMGLDELYGEYLFERVTGTTINWKPGKNLTVKLVKKQSKAKKGRKPVVVTTEEPVDSFFTFFSPPTIDEEKEPTPEDEEALDADFDIGCIFKDKLIPYSVLWFTGEAEEYDEEYDDEYDEENEDDDEDEEEEDEEDEEEDEPEPPKKGAKRGGGGPGHKFAPPPSAKDSAPPQPQQPECKQQ